MDIPAYTSPAELDDEFFINRFLIKTGFSVEQLNEDEKLDIVWSRLDPGIYKEIARREIGFETLIDYWDTEEEKGNFETHPAYIVIAEMYGHYCTYIDHSDNGAYESQGCPLKEIKFFETLKEAENDFNSCVVGYTSDSEKIVMLKNLNRLKLTTSICAGWDSKDWLLEDGYKDWGLYFKVYDYEAADITLISNAKTISQEELIAIDKWYLEFNKRLKEEKIELLEIVLSAEDVFGYILLCREGKMFFIELDIPRSLIPQKLNISELISADDVMSKAESTSTDKTNDRLLEVTFKPRF